MLRAASLATPTIRPRLFTSPALLAEGTIGKAACTTLPFPTALPAPPLPSETSLPTTISRTSPTRTNKTNTAAAAAPITAELLESRRHHSGDEAGIKRSAPAAPSALATIAPLHEWRCHTLTLCGVMGGEQLARPLQAEEQPRLAALPTSAAVPGRLSRAARGVRRGRGAVEVDGEQWVEAR